MITLGVNIDHVMTVRQARDEKYPSLSQAVEVCLDNGADQITAHLREDRRHVQDRDMYKIKEITEKRNKLFNFELSSAPDVVECAKNVKADWVCLVPEKREERTTEGGLNIDNEKTSYTIARAIEKLKNAQPGLKASLFLDTLDVKNFIENKDLGVNSGLVDAIEIHTGDFARKHHDGEHFQEHIDEFNKSISLLEASHIRAHAGHGLSFCSVVPLLKKTRFIEYNIGHFIISEAIFSGLGSVVKKMKGLFDENCISR